MDKRKCLIEKGLDRAKILLLTMKWDSTALTPSMFKLSNTHAHTHTLMHSNLFLLQLQYVSLALLLLLPSGSEPDIPAGPVSLKWLVGAGSRYKGRDWRKPICLAVENGPGPGVNQQPQYTAHSVHIATHVHTHTYKVKHSPLCPHSTAVTRPARFWG